MEIDVPSLYVGILPYSQQTLFSFSFVASGSTTDQHTTSPQTASTSSSTGLMKGPGTPWAGSLVAQWVSPQIDASFDACFTCLLSCFIVHQFLVFFWGIHMTTFLWRKWKWPDIYSKISQAWTGWKERTQKCVFLWSGPPVALLVQSWRRLLLGTP